MAAWDPLFFVCRRAFDPAICLDEKGFVVKLMKEYSTDLRGEIQ
jgi:hypothetical protein